MAIYGGDMIGSHFGAMAVPHSPWQGHVQCYPAMACTLDLLPGQYIWQYIPYMGNIFFALAKIIFAKIHLKK